MTNLFGKRVVSLLTAFILIFTCVYYNIDVSFAASEQIESIPKIYFTQQELEEINATKLPDIHEKNYSTRSIQTKTIKALIKIAIKHKNALPKAVEKVAGKEAGELIAKNLYKILPVLESFLKYETLFYSTIQEQLTSALISSGVTRSVATKIAYWVTQGIQWGL